MVGILMLPGALWLLGMCLLTETLHATLETGRHVGKWRPDLHLQALASGTMLTRLHLLSSRPSLCEEINFSFLCLSLHLGAEFGSVPEHQSVVSRFISRGACAGDACMFSFYSINAKPLKACRTNEKAAHCNVCAFCLAAAVP